MLARSQTRSRQQIPLRFFEELPLADVKPSLQKMASRAVSEAARVLAQGRFLEFAPRRALLTFFQKHPELFFDGNYWDEQYAGLDLEVRRPRKKHGQG